MQAAVFCYTVSCALPQGRCLYSPKCLIAARVFCLFRAGWLFALVVPAATSSGDISPLGPSDVRVRGSSDSRSHALTELCLLCSCASYFSFPDRSPRSQCSNHKAEKPYFLTSQSLLVHLEDLQPLAISFQQPWSPQGMPVLSSLTQNQTCPAFSSSPDPTCYDNALVPWETAGGYSIHNSAAMASLSPVFTGGALDKTHPASP